MKGKELCSMIMQYYDVRLGEHFVHCRYMMDGDDDFVVNDILLIVLWIVAIV